MRKAGPWLLMQANEVLDETHGQLPFHPLSTSGAGAALK